MTATLPISQPWPWRTSLVFLCVALVWFGRNLDFNGYVHPDEPNKVRQILEGNYNFHHPLLMLDSVRLITAITGQRDYDDVMLAGRRTAASYAALAVALLVLVTGRLYGTPVAVAAGIFLLTSPQLFELAHYFKEDPSLLFGVSLSLTVILLYGEKPNTITAALVGAATAIAASAKYAGLIVLPFAIYAIPAAKRPRDVAPMLCAAALLFAAINWPAVMSADIWSRSIGNEVDRLVAVDVPKKRSIPHAAYLEFYWRTSPALVVLLGLYLLGAAKRRFALRPVEWTIILLPATYLIAISCAPTVTQRYFLPIGAVFACLSAAGLLVLANMRYGKFLAIAVAVLAVAWQTPQLVAYERSFACDHQQEVLDYVQTALPPDAVVLVDDYYGFPAPPFEQPIVERRWILPDDNIAALHSAGVTHIVVTQRRHDAAQKGNARALGLDEQQTAAVRKFYEKLFANGTLLREWQRGQNNYLQARFKIYALPDRP